MPGRSVVSHGHALPPDCLFFPCDGGILCRELRAFASTDIGKIALGCSTHG
ncbi:MAG: hypothetical protein ACTSUE_24940 [Promethearchaeota archaeon]